MAARLLDTDALSAIMRRNPAAVSAAGRYLEEHGRFTISVITRYEIERGLKSRGAQKQQAAFEVLWLLVNRIWAIHSLGRGGPVSIIDRIHQ